MTRPRRTRSMRGVIVDFDLMAIREQMASAPAPLTVQARENFIDKKLRRRLKTTQAIGKAKAVLAVSEISAKPKEPVDETIVPVMPGAHEDQGKLIDEQIENYEDEGGSVEKPIVRQKAKK